MKLCMSIHTLVIYTLSMPLLIANKSDKHVFLKSHEFTKLFRMLVSSASINLI